MCKLLLIIVLTASLAHRAMSEAELPDPTRPLEYSGAVQVEKSLQLDSILFGVNRKIAVINGEQRLESQWIGDKQIIAIGRKSVTLKHGDQTIVLSLHGKNIRQ